MEPYSLVPRPVRLALASRRITPAALAVYVAIAEECGGRDSCVLTQPLIGQAVGIGRQAVAAQIRALVAAGLLTVEASGRAARYWPIRPGDMSPRHDVTGISTVPYRHPNATLPASQHDTSVPDGSNEGYMSRQHDMSPDIPARQPIGNVASTLPSYREREDQEVAGSDITLESQDEEFFPSGFSGETPEPPIPARPPAVIPWAMLSDILPAQWLRADAGLRSIAQSIELAVIRNPDHPWFGSRLLRSPETIGGWKWEPDPEYWRV